MFAKPVALIFPTNSVLDILALAVLRLLAAPEVIVVLPSLILEPDNHTSFQGLDSDPKSYPTCVKPSPGIPGIKFELT